jgi:glycine cleavage system protein P-like pyridoxal-binding family
MARPQLKIEVVHEPRNKDANMEQIQKLLSESGVTKVEDVRISVGYRASAVFLTFPDSTSHFTRRIDQFERIVRNTLEKNYYADDVSVNRTWFTATE